ncbi:ABC transporter permease [Propionibacteriaceae bacterium G1746]|uniref:ABC transporter permease n=1 Tax=Aestuariimicrobium sp. G57 TaxID=3418485 RepID=UPI003C174258
MTDTTDLDSTDLDIARIAASGQVPPPLVMAARTRRWGVLYYAETYLRGERAYLSTVLINAIGTPLLYMLAMGVGLGGLLDRTGTTVDGVSYLVFVAPAIMVATASQGAFGESTYPIMGGFKWHRTYYGPAATPMDPAQIAWGHILGVTLRFVMQSVIFWVIMLVFGAAPSGWSWVSIPIAALTALAVACPMQAYAATLENEGAQFVTVQRFVLMPMFLFSGTFYALESMPIYLQWIGWISPLWHGAQLARIASYGMSEPLWLSLVHVVVLVGMVAVGGAMAGRTYRRRLWS